MAVTCHVACNAHEIADPKCPENRNYLENIKAIKRTGAELACYDCTMFAGTPQPLSILNSVKTYHELGYVMYHTESMGRDEIRKIVAWVQAQLAWDATQDPQELLQTFCNECYGAGGASVLATLRLIDTSCRRLRIIIIGGIGTTQMIMNDRVIDRGRRMLDWALKSAMLTRKERERLQRLRDTFEMLSLEAEAVRAYYDALQQRTAEAKEGALSAISNFEEFWKEHKLEETCSSSILAGVLRVKGSAEKISEKPEPSRRAQLKDADRDAVLRDAFAFDTPPQKLANLTFLPEIWKFHLDIRGEGEKAGWMKEDLDESEWWEISAYNFYENQVFPRYDGEFWYRVRFKAPKLKKGFKLLLRIGSLDDDGDIYLNRKLIHRRRHLHPDDWQSSFEVDIAQSVRPGKENLLTIHGFDSYGVGGVWRPSVLYTKPERPAETSR